jgi:Uma2 family endonuclease
MGGYRGPIVPPFLDEYEPRLFTAADLAAMPSEVPSGTVRYELHHGRLITLRPVDWFHGTAVGNLATALLLQGERRGHGKARCGGVGVILARNPDHVFGADVLFVSNARLPIRKSPEDYLETIPDLVVEVAAMNEWTAALHRKTSDYLGAGVTVVWEVYPSVRRIYEYRREAAKEYSDGDTLTVEDVIPGFALPVSVALQE